MNFSELMPAMNVNLSGDFSMDMLKDYAEILEDRIEDISQVSGADIRGTQEKEVKVNVDLYKMESMQVTFGDIEQAIAQENMTISGGDVIVDGLRRNVRVVGEFTDWRTIGDIIVKQEKLNIIQVGSAFGYIGYPGFSAYCASKFGLRGFTQTLAREYSDSGIRFGYFAPRATHTNINAASVEDMNKALGNAMDSVEVVAKAFMIFLNSKKREQVVGWPEKLFARMNGFIPKLVDNAIQSKLSIIKRYLKQSL